jgi:protein tyrosine/serine phosphatase
MAAAMVAAPFVYVRSQDRGYRNFRVVHEGVLYRSGQFSLPALQKVVHQYGIKTVISLRDSDKPTDQDEESWIKASGRNFVRLPPRSWWPDAAGKVPAEANVQAFRAIMDDPKNYPVLVHCFAGIHRTGTMCAIYRMDYQGWSNLEAMGEMRALGYTILDEHDDVRGYLARYRPPQTARPVVGLQVGHTKNHVP